VPPSANILLDLHGFKLIDAIGQNELTLRVEYEIKPQCLHCNYDRLRIKDSFVRRIRHVLYGQRLSWIEVKAHKYCCYRCGKYFNSRFQGILPRKRATEPCRVEVVKLHHHGHTQSHLKEQMGMGSATVERWYQDRFVIKNKELKGAYAPKVLGIDEHFFTRKGGYATTIADLARHKVYDVVLGRSETALRRYLRELPGKEQVRVILMDMSETYRSIAKKYFTNALVVADRFHVIRLINQQFVKTWGDLDETGRRHRGLLSLMRRHPDHFKDDAQKQRLLSYLEQVPGLRSLYGIWQDLLRILRMKGLNQKRCRGVLPELIWIIEELRKTPFKHLQTLGETLHRWREEIARMLRFSKTNGITEGLHNKMEMISRRAYGFRNFENYRLRVRVLCG
jgi:transposase